MTLDEKLARWADRQGWFSLDDKHYLLADGSVVSILHTATQLIIEKDDKVIKRIYKGES